MAALAATTLLGASAARSAAPRTSTPHYQLTDIGIPAGGMASVAAAVNATGQVAGFWRDGNTGYALPFIWSQSGGLRTLSVLPGDAAGVAIDINDVGEVVGLTGNLNGDQHAVLWDASGTPHNLGTLGSNRALAAGINNPTAAHGTQVVGTSVAPFGNMRPFIWDAEHGMRDIGTTDPDLEHFDQWAWAINDASQVTGSMHQPVEPTPFQTLKFRPQAFLWDEQHGPQDRDPTNGSSTGYGINASGKMVGLALTNQSVNGVAIWDESGEHVREDLLTGGPEESAAAFIHQLGINAAGDVAFTDQSIRRASVLIGGVSRDLDTLTAMPEGTFLKSATEINDRGQIVGDFLAADSRSHAYLLTPMAAPATSADLQVTQTASASTAPAGQSVIYTLTVKNLGADAAHGVILTDSLPGTAAFVSSTPAVVPAGEQLTFNLGTIAAGAAQTVTITVRGQVPGVVTNQAAVSSDDPDPNPANNAASTSVTITQAPSAAQAELAVTLTASPTAVQVGKTVTLTAVVTNHGPNAATDVTLTPTFNGAAQTPISIGALGVNKSVTRTFSVTPAVASALNITVAVSAAEADGSPADNSASATVTVQNAPPTPKPDLAGHWSALRIVRSGSAKKPVYTLTGTLTVGNGGTAAAPASTATFAASTDGTLDPGDLRLQTAPNKPVTLKVPALKAGVGKTFKFSFKLPAGMSPSVLTGLNVLATIDAGDKVAELDETNNLAVGGPLQ